MNQNQIKLQEPFVFTFVNPVNPLHVLWLESGCVCLSRRKAEERYLVDSWADWRLRDFSDNPGTRSVVLFLCSLWSCDEARSLGMRHVVVVSSSRIHSVSIHIYSIHSCKGPAIQLVFPGYKHVWTSRTGTMFPVNSSVSYILFTKRLFNSWV